MRIILFLNRYDQLIIIYLRCQTNKWHSSCRREKFFMVYLLFEVEKKGGKYIFFLLTNPAKNKGPSQAIGKGLCFSALILSVFIASQSPHPTYAPSPPQWALPPYEIYPLPGRLLPWSSQRPLRSAPPCRRHWRL